MRFDQRNQAFVSPGIAARELLTPGSLAELEGELHRTGRAHLSAKRFALLLGLGALLDGCSFEANPGQGYNPGTVEDSSSSAGGPSTTPATDSSPTQSPAPTSEAKDTEDIFAALPTGEAQLTALCARGNGDPISAKLCVTPRPSIKSLADLQRALGLDFKPGVNSNGSNGNPAFAVSGHSSSLVVSFINAINPRAIIFTPPNGNPNPNFIAMGFARGEQFSELVARDSKTGQLNFFLVRFSQACTESKSCSNADLLTPAVESNWTGFTVYQDVDLKNTVADCLHCHQPGGPGTQKMLRMQELRNPWTHFFRNNRTGGQALIADYQSAHANTETYAGIPGALIPLSDPARLENLVRQEGFGTQPNEFATSTIENEVSNSATGDSTTWQSLYANVLNGSMIPVPYRAIRVADPAKLTSAANAYKAVMAGTSAPSTLPDFRHIFSDAALEGMSLRPKAGLAGADIMKQMCQRCHNATLDQSISRAKFDVTKLATMSREEKDLAIKRLKLPAEHKEKMPPPRFGTLSQAEIDLVVQELQR